TVADRPGAVPKRAETSPPTVADRPGAVAKPAEGSVDRPHTIAAASQPGGASLSLTTAADALRDEEVERTRKFIVGGWGISIARSATVPVLPSPLPLQIAMVTAMVAGIVGSSFFSRAFADTRRYTESALVKLAMMCILNAQVALLYYGVFTVAPSIIVV